jgi:hypothetical protein
MSSISDQPAIYKNLGSDKTLQQIRGGCRASTTRSRSQCHYKVPNWQTYEAGLWQRGSLTIWFTEEAIAAWRAGSNAFWSVGQSDPGITAGVDDALI